MNSLKRTFWSDEVLHEGASNCVEDVLVEVLSILLPHMEDVLHEKSCSGYHTTATHRLHYNKYLILVGKLLRIDGTTLGISSSCA